jgi:hypothetical protein
MSKVSLSYDHVRSLAASPHLAAVQEIHVLVDEHIDCNPEIALEDLKARFPKVIRH